MSAERGGRGQWGQYRSLGHESFDCHMNLRAIRARELIDAAKTYAFETVRGGRESKPDTTFMISRCRFRARAGDMTPAVLMKGEQGQVFPPGKGMELECMQSE